jgi:uncharacterized protein (DUF3084 family)
MFVYFEPAKGAVANALALQMQGAIADESAELVQTNLISVWNNMQALSRDIDDKLIKIPQMRSSFYVSRNKLVEIRNNMNSQDTSFANNMMNTIIGDVSGMQTSITDMQAKLTNWENSNNQISTYDQKLSYYDSRLQSTDNQLASIQNNLYSWDSKLAARINQLDNAYNTMNNYLQIVRTLKSGASGTELDQLT